MLNFVGKRHLYFIFSAAVLIPAIISLLIPPGLRPGIEFTSGTLMTVRFEDAVEQGQLRGALQPLGHGDAILQRTGEGEYLIRTSVLEEGERDASGNLIVAGERERLEEALGEAFGPFTVLSFDAVSPIVAAEIVRNAAIAVVVASVAILLYITVAFRQVPSPFRYGVCAILALVHDVLVVLGVFSLAGKLFGTEIDSLFITATLTVIGFSVHDTIVVFDRIRENVQRNPTRDFASNVNNSLIQTLGRSLTTSITLLFTLVAILIFGGVTIQNFILALTVGVISGVYSSIFIASQLLVVWEYGEIGRLFSMLGLRRAEAVR